MSITRAVAVAGAVRLFVLREKHREIREVDAAVLIDVMHRTRRVSVHRARAEAGCEALEIREESRTAPLDSVPPDRALLAGDAIGKGARVDAFVMQKEIAIGLDRLVPDCVLERRFGWKAQGATSSSLVNADALFAARMGIGGVHAGVTRANGPLTALYQPERDSTQPMSPARGACGVADSGSVEAAMTRKTGHFARVLRGAKTKRRGEVGSSPRRGLASFGMGRRLGPLISRIDGEGHRRRGGQGRQARRVPESERRRADPDTESA